MLCYRTLSFLGIFDTFTKALSVALTTMCPQLCLLIGLPPTTKLRIHAERFCQQDGVIPSPLLLQRGWFFVEKVMEQLPSFWHHLILKIKTHRPGSPTILADAFLHSWTLCSKNYLVRLKLDSLRHNADVSQKMIPAKSAKLRPRSTDRTATTRETNILKWRKAKIHTNIATRFAMWPGASLSSLPQTTVLLLEFAVTACWNLLNS